MKIGKILGSGIQITKGCAHIHAHVVPWQLEIFGKIGLYPPSGIRVEFSIGCDPKSKPGESIRQTKEEFVGIIGGIVKRVLDITDGAIQIRYDFPSIRNGQVGLVPHFATSIQLLISV